MGVPDHCNFLSADHCASCSQLASLYQCVDRLPLHRKAALAQYILNTHELSVVVTNRPSVETVIQQMNPGELGDILESIAARVLTLEPPSPGQDPA
jgi:hypothetical protein